MAEEASEVKTGSEEMEAKKNQIMGLTAKKHVKIWLLHEVCLLKNKEICDLVGSNAGAVNNALKSYQLEPHKMEEARKLLA